MRRVYKSRREALLDALIRHFGDRVRVLGDSAGLHVVVRLGVPDLAERAARAGVRVLSTAPYYAGPPLRDEWILRFSGVAGRALVEAVRRLARSPAPDPQASRSGGGGWTDRRT